MEKRQTVYEKALEINLDPSIYGVFAEIERVKKQRLFFRVSASAGTVAKTISAYDMVMSDALYGKTERYVSQERLQSMLRYEFDLLVERLGKTRGMRRPFSLFVIRFELRVIKMMGNVMDGLGCDFR